MVIGSDNKASVAVNELIKRLPPDSEITCSEHFRQGPLAPVIKPDSKVSLNYWNMKETHTLLSSLCTSIILDYDIVVFAEDIADAFSHDALSLMLLAGINAACKEGNNRPRIVMDMLDSNNVQLAQTANADDVIIGTEVTSNYMFQIARAPVRHAIFSELMSSWGTEIGFRPASLYQCGEKPFSFVDVMREARRQNELAIGYVYEEDGAEKVVLNPSFADRQATNPDIRKIAVLIEKINGGPQSQFLI